MKLIVGLGNPETKYNFTRHNFGFLTLDYYAKVKGIKWEKSEKFNAIWAKVKAGEIAASSNSRTPGKKQSVESDFILIKPQTYYNEVGRAVQAFSHFYKIAPKDILVVCDDFNIEFGKLRYREAGSAGGNNGLKSVIADLGSAEFPRLRLGTGHPALRQKLGDTEFVLGKFTPEEKAKLPEILAETEKKLDELI